jgi:purine-binding chemotaxis protein CheW
LENISDYSLEEKMKILRKRAELLAEEPSKEIEQDTMEVLVFQIADEKYAVESRYVTKILLLNDLCFLPGVPSFIIGIINVRGHIIPVIDIKKIFEIPNQKSAEESTVVVVETRDAIFGIIADNILGLTRLSLNEIQNSLPMLSGIRAEYLKGVSDAQLVILDPLKLASDKNLLVNDEF